MADSLHTVCGINRSASRDQKSEYVEVFQQNKTLRLVKADFMMKL